MEKHRISTPERFGVTETRTIKLNASKPLHELVLYATVENHWNENGVLFISSNGIKLSLPIPLGTLPNEVKLSDFLLDSVSTDHIYDSIDINYFKGTSDGIWTIAFLEESDNAHFGELKTNILLPSLQGEYNYTEFDQPQPFKGIRMQIDLIDDKFVGQTLECRIYTASHGQNYEQSLFIPLKNIRSTFQFTSPVMGLNVNLEKIAFRLLTRGIPFTEDDIITIEFREVY